MRVEGYDWNSNKDNEMFMLHNCDSWRSNFKKCQVMCFKETAFFLRFKDWRAEYYATRWIVLKIMPLDGKFWKIWNNWANLTCDAWRLQFKKLQILYEFQRDSFFLAIQGLHRLNIMPLDEKRYAGKWIQLDNVNSGRLDV